MMRFITMIAALFFFGNLHAQTFRCAEWIYAPQTDSAEYVSDPTVIIISPELITFLHAGDSVSYKVAGKTHVIIDGRPQMDHDIYYLLPRQQRTNITSVELHRDHIVVWFEQMIKIWYLIDRVDK